MRLLRGLAIVALCVFSVWQAAHVAAGYELSRGRQIVLNKGVQLGAWGFYMPDTPINVSRFVGANYTMPDTKIDPSELAKPGLEGTLFGTNACAQEPISTFYYHSPSYANQLVAIDYEDEPGPYVNPGELPLLNSTRLSGIQALYSSWRDHFPNALMYLSTAGLREYTSNSSGTGGTEAGLRAYIEGAQPDMLMYDVYPRYSGSGSNVWSDRTTWYSNMATFRRQALLGVDGQGTKPLVYGQYMNMYRTSQNGTIPDESFVRTQRFASLAFGFQFLEDYVYSCHPSWNSSNIYAAMFDSNGDSQPNAAYYSMSEANRQIRNLSPALSRLVSTGVGMMPGKHLENFLGFEYVVNNGQPSGVSSWSAGAGGQGDYITGVTRLGFAHGGDSRIQSDILIGYFRPLLSDNRNCTFVDGLNFMIVNGLSGDSAYAMAQTYRLAFNFGDSGNDALVRLDRDTGEVTPISLTYDGSPGIYHYDLTLEGGTGDLFRFWDSSTPLPTIPEPGTLTLLGTALVAGLYYTWRKRKS